MTERLGADADAMRSSAPVRICKWVRTDEVAQFGKDEDEAMADVPNAPEAGTETTPAPKHDQGTPAPADGSQATA